ncbi:hypothetical protein [Abyssalbus ytuae]|uniref:Uncharacterized protein n=1 Tax=Abyssalbus ytuae TaxID=2926907 RepID=A0A9E7D0Q1_9FLAO|nr:hypothetical protein [Abyssalbus ytuae]UOB16253.1 hypothetical protein MQE35_10945 [Abyssalbus ytuae]
MKQEKLLWILPFICFINFIVSGQSDNPAQRYKNAYKQYINATCPLENDSIKHFVYFARERELIHNHPLLNIKRIAGAQIMYSWKQLEPKRGEYDFSIIHEDYNYLLSHGKKLFIQFQDVTFNTSYIAVPDYLLTDEFDGGCTPAYNDEDIAEGWVAKRWNSQVQYRFALLMNALGKEFDGKIEGINLQETAVGVNGNRDTSFTPQHYTKALKSNMLALKKAFPKSTTMQYANFMPGEWLPWEDKGYLRSIYQYGNEIGVGLGAPDLMVQRKAQLNHALAMMHENNYTVPLGIAIQDGNYIGKTGADRDYNEHSDMGASGRENIVPLLHAFAKNFLRVNYMFWVCQEPYFSEDVISCLNSN